MCVCQCVFVYEWVLKTLTRDVQRGRYFYLYLLRQKYWNKSGNRRNDPVFVVALNAAKIGDVEERFAGTAHGCVDVVCGVGRILWMGSSTHGCQVLVWQIVGHMCWKISWPEAGLSGKLQEAPTPLVKFQMPFWTDQTVFFFTLFIKSWYFNNVYLNTGHGEPGSVIV